LNPQLGFEFLTDAAARGSPDAQHDLSVIYSGPNGSRFFRLNVPMDKRKSFLLAMQAAMHGLPSSANSVADRYAAGEGVAKDEIEALAWYYITASYGDAMQSQMEVLFKPAMQELETRLGQQAVLVAQQRARAIQASIKPPVIDNSEAFTPGAGEASDPKGSGSGVIVTASGYVLTAAHVVEGATSIKVVTALGTFSASVARSDPSNDLALLKIADAKPFSPISIGSSRAVRLGQPMATIGFPNPSIQGFSPKVTKGEISALNGAQDDPRMWQISVPVQTGNSGGPLLDADGELVGVVVSKLSIKAAEVTGDLPQNVGYAVKGIYAQGLLDPYLPASEAARPEHAVKFEDMVANAAQSVVLILVY
jgi:S1-C subfamily serine protease